MRCSIILKRSSIARVSRLGNLRAHWKTHSASLATTLTLLSRKRRKVPARCWFFSTTGGSPGGGWPRVSIMSKTLFEKIAAREVPAKIVYEDEQVLALQDIKPAAPMHVLIVPKKPIPRIAAAQG